jgi:hypothetical protein
LGRMHYFTGSCVGRCRGFSLRRPVPDVKEQLLKV